MVRERIEDVSHPDAGDVTLGLIRAAASSVPVLGPAAVELLGLVIVPPLEAKRNEWLNQLADDLDRLSERVDGFEIRALAGHDEFISAVALGVGAVSRTSQPDKRDLLRHAVLNAALGRVPAFDMLTVFMAYVEYLSPLHVQLLAVFHDPAKALEDAGSQLASSLHIGGSPVQIVAEVLPDLGRNRDVCDFLWRDLYERRLVNLDSLHGMMSAQGVLARRTTDLGEQFLEFLSEPPELGLE